jgi:hypothetical protein
MVTLLPVTMNIVKRAAFLKRAPRWQSMDIWFCATRRLDLMTYVPAGIKIFPPEGPVLEIICCTVAVSSKLPETVRGMVSVRLRPPPVAEIVMVELPTVPPQFAESVSTDAKPPDDDIVDGLNVPETPCGNPVTDKLIGLVKPPVAAAVTFNEADELLPTLTDARLEVMAKSG